MGRKKLEWPNNFATLPESRLVEQIHVLSFRGSRRSSDKIHDDMGNDKSMKKEVFKMKRCVNKLTTSNRLKFKLVSGTHDLRSEWSRRDNGCNISVCAESDKEESVEQFLLEWQLYNGRRNIVANY
eukprot:Awhi_evm1s15788